MNSVMIATPTVKPDISAKQLYWQGYDMYTECFFSGDFLSAEEYAAMTPAARRGYDAAARHQADTATDVYLSNRNAYGDLTEY